MATHDAARNQTVLKAICIVSLFIALASFAMAWIACCKDKDVCYAHAQLGNSSNKWTWILEKCPRMLETNDNKVKINSRGIYIVHVQVTCSLPKKPMDSNKTDIELKVSSNNNKSRNIMRSLYLPPTNSSINRPTRSSFTLDSTFLLNKGDTLQLFLKFDMSSVFGAERDSFWNIYKIVDL